MVSPLIASAMLLQTGVSTVSGTVSYRERIALPPGVEVTVTAIRYLQKPGVAAGQTMTVQERLSETTFRSDQQVPIPFVLLLPKGPSSGNKIKIGLIAKIRHKGEVIWESEKATYLKSAASQKVDLQVVRAQSLANAWKEKNLTVFEMNGVKFSEPNLPTLTFGKNGQFESFTGVNRMSGKYTQSPNFFQIDPGPTTLMAGSHNQMKIEMTFTGLLPQVNRVEYFEGVLTLLRGNTPLIRLK